ncbi:MAG: ubiquinone biosynthesis protein UbiA [Sphingobacteriales bacterium]|nr:MAG: ubiquinone biosynthesis protein UbiA [Sphingobacteriales bacterium]TAF79958.1 MAG: ubiquinone biosynthesis protein UbiA [Sphingobacteriales bacterium]
MSIFSKANLLHLRLPFSVLLLPVYVFAISQTTNLNVLNALLVFVVWHLLVYPASNAYNSYFDKDEGSIALLKNPPKIQRNLYHLAVTLEWLGVALAAIVSWHFAFCVLLYNVLSKAYSNPKIRLKKYPIVSFLVVFVFQGWFIYVATYYAVGNIYTGFNAMVFLAGLVCSCLIGASYPLTQVYQHAEDGKRGDKTLSILLGIRGSFLFSGGIFFLGFGLMRLYWQQAQQLLNFYVFGVITLPVLGFFSWWFWQVLKNEAAASYQNMMRTTVISATVLLVYFLWVLV